MKNILSIIVLTLLFLSGCKYEDFELDFDYSNVYFAYQNPVRTVISSDPTVKVGVVMGGVRRNTVDQTVKFSMHDSLLNYVDGADNFTLLPADYYSISSDNEIIIKSGELAGWVDISFTDAFFADTLSLEEHYALPFLITEATVDSILVGDPDNAVQEMNYSVVVFKYRNQYHGSYYHRGTQDVYEPDGITIQNTIRYATIEEYDEKEPEVAWDLVTVDTKTLKTNGLANNPVNGDDNNYSLFITHTSEGQITVKEGDDSFITNVIDNGSSYNEDKKTYYLNYEYTLDGIRNVMTDTLWWRNDLMTLELW